MISPDLNSNSEVFSTLIHCFILNLKPGSVSRASPPLGYFTVATHIYFEMSRWQLRMKRFTFQWIHRHAL